MRFLVHGLVGSNLGGIETFLLNMNDFMSPDCIFDYVIEEDECIHEDRINAKGGRVYKIRPRSKNVIGNTIDIIRLYRKLKDEYSVIYYNLSSLSWILPEIVGKMMRYRIVVHSHNAMLIDANCGFFHRNMNRINRWIISHMKVQRLACSKNASEFMFDGKESTIIYNGIDVEKYRFSEEQRKRIREQYGINGNSFVVGTVGRLAYEKNPLFTVDIFCEIHKKNPDSVLIMFGEGNLRKEIGDKVNRLGISEKVIMPGNVNNVNEVLNVMDVFVLPSRHEGLGIALIEAQANGLPCFTSKDVVPAEAKVTDLLEFVSLDKTANEWSDMLTRTMKDENRKRWCDLVKNSHFNIKDEASRLERILSYNEAEK